MTMSPSERGVQGVAAVLVGAVAGLCIAWAAGCQLWPLPTPVAVERSAITSLQPEMTGPQTFARVSCWSGDHWIICQPSPDRIRLVRHDGDLVDIQTATGETGHWSTVLTLALPENAGVETSLPVFTDASIFGTNTLVVGETVTVRDVCLERDIPPGYTCRCAPHATLICAPRKSP